MALMNWLIILALVILTLWLMNGSKARGSCPLAGTGACQCGLGRGEPPCGARIRADELLSRS